MSHNLVTESDQSIAFFSDFLSHLRFMKSLYNDISNQFENDEEKKVITNFYKLNDISSLITICHLDLITNSKHLYLAKSDWEKIFFIKNIFLVIYETINSLHKHQQFLYVHSQQFEITLELHITASNSLKEFKKNYKYDSHINKIRNNISGHINENFEEYYDEIISFNGETTALMAFSFLKVIENFQNLFNKLINTIEIDTSKLSSEKIVELQRRLDNLVKKN